MENENNAKERQAAVTYFYQGHPVGSARTTLSEEAYLELTGTKKEVKPEPVKKEKTETKEKDTSKLAVVIALVIFLPLGYVLLVFVLYKLNMWWRNRKK